MAKKTQFWAKFDFGGSCTDPLLPMRAKFSALEKTRDIRLLSKFRLDCFILSPSGGEKHQFLPFFGLRLLVCVANWQQSDKVEHGCTTHSFSARGR